MKILSAPAVLLVATALAPVEATPDESRGTLQVLLQGESAAALSGLVEEVGGEVTHDLHIIDAVGAELTRSQLDTLLASGAVERYLDDLADEDEPEEDEDACRVRGHIELTTAPGKITWPLYNKRDETATWERLTLNWPPELGPIGQLTLGTHALSQGQLNAQADGSLEVTFTGEAAPSISGRQDLVATFPDTPRSAAPTDVTQDRFAIEAAFRGGCDTSLVPGYPNNYGDYYYNTVAQVDPLHLQGIRGQGVTVAVIDSGLWEHPALMRDTDGKPRVLARYDAIADTAGSEVVDESGHGTHMASIIANSERTTRDGRPTGTFKGVAPDARLVAVKILDREGFAHLLDIVRAVQWVVDNREKYQIRVLNLSFAQMPRWHYWEDPVNQAVMRAWASGIVVVAAAGNEGPEPMTIGSPGNLPYVITVGLVTDSWTPETRDDDYIPDFSSRGPTPSGHVKPEVVALGGHMTGLVHPESDLATTQPEDILANGDYVSTGSSQAAALVSGIAALLLQLEPGLSPDDIKCKLVSSAEPAINRDGLLAYSPFQQGFGYVTAARAVTLGKSGCGNADLDLAADIGGTEHFFGPALFDEDGNATLPDLELLVSTEASAKGMSDTRKWGVKDHIERDDPGPGEEQSAAGSAFDWREIYLLEKEAIERLASGAESPEKAAQ